MGKEMVRKMDLHQVERNVSYTNVFFLRTTGSYVLRLTTRKAKTRCSHKPIHHRLRSLSGFSNLPSVFPNVRKGSLMLPEVNGYLENIIAGNYENWVGAMGRYLAGNARDSSLASIIGEARLGANTTKGERRICATRARARFEKAIRI